MRATRDMGSMQLSWDYHSFSTQLSRSLECLVDGSSERFAMVGTTMRERVGVCWLSSLWCSVSDAGDGGSSLEELLWREEAGGSACGMERGIACDRAGSVARVSSPAQRMHSRERMSGKVGVRGHGMSSLSIWSEGCWDGHEGD